MNNVYISIEGQLTQQKLSHIMPFYARQKDYFENKKERIDSLNILLSSQGGDMFAVKTTYNYLFSLPTKIVTYNMGIADSAAILLFSIGSDRYACDGSRFFFHRFTSDPALNVDQMREKINQLEELEDFYSTTIASELSGNIRTTNAIKGGDATNPILTATMIRDYMRAERTLNTTDALSGGLITGVQHPKIRPGDVFVTIS